MKNPKYYNGSRIRNAWTNLNFIDRKVNKILAYYFQK